MPATNGLRVSVLALAVISLTATAHSQTTRDFIQLGSTALRLGSAQDDVLQKLRNEFDVNAVGSLTKGSASSWLVTEKGNSKDAVGNVYFEGGKLRTIYKYWTVNEPDREVSFANLLYGAIRNFEHEGRTNCVISTQQQQQPTLDDKAIFLACGNKYLKIDVVNLENEGQSAQIIEILGTSSAKH